MVIGNKFNYGHKFAEFVAENAFVSKICVLQGGIDAYRAEFPQLLRKAKNKYQSEQDFLVQFERFVKKAQAIRAQ